MTFVLGIPPDKFYTLPRRRKRNQSQERRYSDDVVTNSPPKKPPRTFATNTQPSLFNTLFKKDSFSKKDDSRNKKKKKVVKRSVSDITGQRPITSRRYDDLRKSHSGGSESEDNSGDKKRRGSGTKKQLSPIIEVTPREDYFSVGNDKEKVREKSGSVTEQLKEYIDEIDGEIFRETGVRVSPPVEKKKTDVVIIDVEKAAQIESGKKKRTKLGLGKKLKALTKRNKKSVNNRERSEEREKVLKENVRRTAEEKQREEFEELREIEENLRNILCNPSPRIKETIATLERQARKQSSSPEMIHSSQKPAEKLPLTKGRTVDNMVKRLSTDTSSPPPKPNVMVVPNTSVQHNNNQPFSYIRGLSPDKISQPVIYAQVVCDDAKQKQTVHMSYNNGKKHIPHSDSDEGLGYEDFTKNKSSPTMGFDDFPEYEENPITPKYQQRYYHQKYEENPLFYMDRGRADGIESKRRESLTENRLSPERDFGKVGGSRATEFGRSDLSARRDLLESRINSRQFLTLERGERAKKYKAPSPPTLLQSSNSPPSNVYVATKTTESSRYYRSGSTSPTIEEKKFLVESTTRRGSDERRVVERKLEAKYRDNPRARGYSERKRNDPIETNDFQSSPEQYKYRLRNRDYYRSNPEISHESRKLSQGR